MIVRYKFWKKEQTETDPVMVTVETVSNDIDSQALGRALARAVEDLKVLIDDTGARMLGVSVQTVDFYAEQKHDGIKDIC